MKNVDENNRVLVGKTINYRKTQGQLKELEYRRKVDSLMKATPTLLKLVICTISLATWNLILGVILLLCLIKNL